MNPKGKLKIVKTKVKQIKNLSIYVDIYFKDEDKVIWKQTTGDMLFNLEKVGKL